MNGDRCAHLNVKKRIVLFLIFACFVVMLSFYLYICITSYFDFFKISELIGIYTLMYISFTIFVLLNVFLKLINW